jgi:hypothetical protein
VKRTAKIPRRIPAHWRKPIKVYGAAIGELVWASNHAQSTFALIFAMLINRRLDFGIAAWNSHNSDSAQRQMLAELVELRFPEESHGKLRSDLLWAKGQADKLATIRNDAVHAATRLPLGPSPRAKLTVDTLITHKKRAARLNAEKDSIKKFRVAKYDLVQLCDFLWALTEHLLVDDSYKPWPQRPRLRSVPESVVLVHPKRPKSK